MTARQFGEMVVIACCSGLVMALILLVRLRSQLNLSEVAAFTAVFGIVVLVPLFVGALHRAPQARMIEVAFGIVTNVERTGARTSAIERDYQTEDSAKAALTAVGEFLEAKLGASVAEGSPPGHRLNAYVSRRAFDLHRRIITATTSRRDEDLWVLRVELLHPQILLGATAAYWGGLVLLTMISDRLAGAEPRPREVFGIPWKSALTSARERMARGAQGGA